jgi:SAM-dependent methyltransferase
MKNKYKQYDLSWFSRSANVTRQLIPNDFKGSLLDLGCYKGFLRKYLNKNVVYKGLDIDKHFEGIIQHDLNYKKIPSKSKSFDCVIATNIIEHLFYPEEIMKEISRVMKDDGFAIISLPNDVGIGGIFYRVFVVASKSPSVENQKYMHHWVFTLKSAKEFIQNYFKIVDEFYDFSKLQPVRFILPKQLCSNYYAKCVKK